MEIERLKIIKMSSLDRYLRLIFIELRAHIHLHLYKKIQCFISNEDLDKDSI